MDTLSQLNTALAGRYVVEREIGAGGMATVFLARDLRHDRHVALKLLKAELGAVLGVERFLSEIKVTANLQHPNLLPLFDSGEATGLLYYVMPFVEGESLRARLDREKQLPVDEAIRIAVAVAAALDYAHQHGVIHRDLKPENILLQAGQPVVSDFGIALAVSNAGGTRVTQTGLSLGTPQYMSPEQATGDRVIDGRSDIYSLAAVTYEMLTGEPPHTGNTAQAIIARVLTEHPRHVRSTRPNVPEHVERALERALEKLPADRWTTAHEFAEALQGRMVTVTTSAAVATAAARPRLPSWRAQVRNPLVLVLAAVAVAASAVAVRAWTVANRRTREPVVRFTLALLRDVVGPTGTPVVVSPDGRTIVFAGRSESGRTQLYLRPLNELRPRGIPGTENGSQPFFSPDGRWIGFWAAGKLAKVPVEGGAALPIAEMPLPNGATWTPRDVIVASIGNDLFTVPASGGSPTLLPGRDSARGETVRQWPVALPDGENVLYASWSTGGLARARIGVASLASGRSTVLEVTGACPLGFVAGHLVYATANQAVMAVPFDVGAGGVTGTPTPVTTDVVVGPGGAAKASLSATGTLAFLSGSQASQLVLRDAQGADRPVIGEPGAYAYPRFSPDGKRIALTLTSGPRSDIWIYDIAAATMTRLTSDGSANERPEWTPDGKRVLYRSDRGNRSAIWWQPADLSGPAAPLIADDRADFYEGVMTRDGRAVVYQLDTAGADVMYRMLAGDTTPKPIAATPFVEDRARVSPDGRWVAFMTDASGTAQVAVQPFPGPGGQVQVSTSGGSEPVWSLDGRRLFYRDGTKLVAVTWEASPMFRVTSRAVLFDDTYVIGASPHANYDVSPDGRGFLLLKPIEASQVIVVHNWIEEMRARVAGRAAR